MALLHRPRGICPSGADYLSSPQVFVILSASRSDGKSTWVKVGVLRPVVLWHGRHRRSSARLLHPFGYQSGISFRLPGFFSTLGVPNDQQYYGRLPGDNLSRLQKRPLIRRDCVGPLKAKRVPRRRAVGGPGTYNISDGLAIQHQRHLFSAGGGEKNGAESSCQLDFWAYTRQLSANRHDPRRITGFRRAGRSDQTPRTTSPIKVVPVGADEFFQRSIPRLATVVGDKIDVASPQHPRLGFTLLGMDTIPQIPTGPPRCSGTAGSKR